MASLVDATSDNIESAIASARAAVASDPGSEVAARHLTDLVRSKPRYGGDEDDWLASAHPAVRQADELLRSGKEEDAEIVLRRHLAANRNDPHAMLVMAEIANRCGFTDNAEKILRRSIEVHPDRVENRVALAKLLHGIALTQDRFSLVEELMNVLDDALRIDPQHWGALSLRASIAVQIRRMEEGSTAFARLLELRPSVSFTWMNYAYLLKTMGSFGEAVAAYRMAVALDPRNGGAWWGLANLKLFRFFPSDVAEMEVTLSEDLPDDARVEINFALSKAFDDQRDFSRAAGHLIEGNRLRLELHPYEGEQVREGIDEAIRIFTPEFFAHRKGQGHGSAEPIFIVGMPRSGSTLVEQILASHPLVEGTEELFAMQQLDGELQQARGGISGDQALVLADADELHRLGDRYLHLSHYHRKSGRPHFTDKNPANWRYVGLIHAILPNAKVIDVRRNPLDCCFANYTQHYQWGVNFSYGQAEIANQYRQYLRLMRHFDSVMPGVVHHSIHDELVEDFEEEVRRLLDYLGLPFDDACLRYFDNKRAVHTPSAEQVRRPINREGFGRWRNYEPWIGELKSALGGVMDDWKR